MKTKSRPKDKYTEVLRTHPWELVTIGARKQGKSVELYMHDERGGFEIVFPASSKQSAIEILEGLTDAIKQF